MHILMATVDALKISSDDIVLNRTTLQQMREKNRQDQFNEAKSDTIDKVTNSILNSYYWYNFISLIHRIHNIFFVQSIIF